MAHTWRPNLPTYLNCGYSLATYSSATQLEIFQNAAINTKFSNIFPYTARLYSINYSLFLFYLSFMTGLTDYININKQLKREKNSFTTPLTKTTAITEYRAMSVCRRRSINYGSPPWNTAAALRFLSLRRDFLQDYWRYKAALKLISSTRRCC